MHILQQFGCRGTIPRKVLLRLAWVALHLLFVYSTLLVFYVSEVILIVDDQKVPLTFDDQESRR